MDTVTASRVRSTRLQGAESANVWTTHVAIGVKNVVLRTISFCGRKARERHGYPITRLPVKVSDILKMYIILLLNRILDKWDFR